MRLPTFDQTDCALITHIRCYCSAGTIGSQRSRPRQPHGRITKMKYFNSIPGSPKPPELLQTGESSFFSLVSFSMSPRAEATMLTYVRVQSMLTKRQKKKNSKTWKKWKQKNTNKKCIEKRLAKQNHVIFSSIPDAHHKHTKITKR